MIKMPESNSAGLIGSIIGGLSFIAGLALSLVGFGRKVERVEASLARSHERHAEHDRRLDSFETAMKSMMAIFTTADGEPRFMTGIACGREQASCHKELLEKFASGSARFGTIEADVKEIKDSQADNLQVILDEIRKKR